MNTHKGLRSAGVALAVAMLMALSAPTSATAINTSRINYLTFGGAVALPGVTLPAGSYTFELVPPSGSRNIVRVSTRDGRRLIFMGFTHVVLRPAGMRPDATVTFGERNGGEPAPITAWYPAGSDTGHGFIYR